MSHAPRSGCAAGTAATTIAAWRLSNSSVETLGYYLQDKSRSLLNLHYPRNPWLLLFRLVVLERDPQSHRNHG